MKKVRPSAPHVHKPFRRHLRRRSEQLRPIHGRTNSLRGTNSQATAPLIRVIIETDRTDLARLIQSNLPEGSYLTIAEIGPAGRSEMPAIDSESSADFDVTQLTGRQHDVVRLLMAGLANKEIGRKLDLSHFTVRNHVSQIFRLLGVSSRKEAIVKLKACHPERVEN